MPSYPKDPSEYIQRITPCVKVKDLISTAKYKYYQNKAKCKKCHNPDKWYCLICKLAGASNPQSTLTAPTAEELQELSEKLQEAFTDPWKDLNSMSACDDCEVQNLKDHNPTNTKYWTSQKCTRIFKDQESYWIRWNSYMVS